MIWFLAAGAAGLAGWALWPKSTPKLQGIRRITPEAVAGVPAGTSVQIVVPIETTAPVSGVASVPIPANNTGTDATYAPKAVVSSRTPGSLTLAPTVITPTGASSLAIETTQDIQNALNTLGIAQPPLRIDGQVGAGTKAAILKFQMLRGLTADGAAGTKTKSALQTALGELAGTGFLVGNSMAVQTATADSMSVGMKNLKPVSVQHALNMLGASPLLVEDGKMGPKTVAALKAFQIAHSLTADGVAGPKTKTALAMAIKQPDGNVR